MKVLDLQCGLGHTFEGWFGSEADYLSQTERGMVQCPLCGDSQILKKLSAPRLNLSHRQEPSQPGSQATRLQHESQHKPDTEPQLPHSSGSAVDNVSGPDLAAAWMHMARRIVAQTDDVGTEFAEVARKMHYGETPERAIRGKTTPDEARSLLDEGIEVLPFVLPEGLKEPLQ